jgi:hypothetical protein
MNCASGKSSKETMFTKPDADRQEQSEPVIVYFFDNPKGEPDSINVFEAACIRPDHHTDVVSIPSPRVIFEQARQRSRSAFIPHLSPTPRARATSRGTHKKYSSRMRPMSAFLRRRDSYNIGHLVCTVTGHAFMKSFSTRSAQKISTSRQNVHRPCGRQAVLSGCSCVV